jgi:hypothetical protein
MDTQVDVIIDYNDQLIQDLKSEFGGLKLSEIIPFRKNSLYKTVPKNTLWSDDIEKLFE